MPFDALWLAQCAAVYLHPGRMDGLYRAPFCTMFAATGDRAGAEGIRVARALDWSGPEAPTLIEVRPTSGHAYVHVGFPWNAGVFTGMNDAGLVVAVERVQGLGDPGFDGPPIEFVLRQVLESMSTVGEAVEHMGTLQGVRGYHVLVAGPGPGRAVVVEFGDRITLREAANGLLLGIDPESDFVDDEARTRYRRVDELVKDERIIGTNEMEAVLLDQEEGRIGRARIFNEDTRHCVVFEPATRSMRVSFPTEDGRPGPFRSWTLREQAP